jgi:chaperonin GroES
MNLKPLHDWAVIRPAGAEEMTAGGLIIPDTAKEKPQEGVVEAIGPGAYEEEEHRRKKKDEKKERRFIPTTVKPGDRVIYERYAGRTYTISGEERILVRERDILGILERPLQIPAVTSTSATTAVSVRPVPSPVMKVKETSTAGKTAKVAVQKSVKKKASKTAPKKKAAAKAAKKAVVKSKIGAKKATAAKGPGVKAKKSAVKKAKKKK